MYKTCGVSKTAWLALDYDKRVELIQARVTAVQSAIAEYTTGRALQGAFIDSRFQPLTDELEKLTPGSIYVLATSLKFTDKDAKVGKMEE